MQGIWNREKTYGSLWNATRLDFTECFTLTFPKKRLNTNRTISFCELLQIVNFNGFIFLTALCSEIDVSFSLVASVGQREFHFPRSDALPLNHRDSTMSETHYEVHIWRAPTLATRRKTSFSISSPSSKLTIDLSYSSWIWERSLQ